MCTQMGVSQGMTYTSVSDGRSNQHFQEKSDFYEYWQLIITSINDRFKNKNTSSIPRGFKNKHTSIRNRKNSVKVIWPKPYGADTVLGYETAQRRRDGHVFQEACKVVS